MAYSSGVRRTLQLGVASIALCGSIPAFAQTAGTATGAQDDYDDNVIVVTGRLREERLQDVPLAVTALGGEMLQEKAITDIQGIAKMVPMMVVGRQVSGSAASIFLRGVGSSSLSSGFDQSVAINLDGIAMSRGREIVNTQYDLKQVEVLKGPQALFFGKNSTGGVISITTADPTREREISGRVGYEFEARERYIEGVLSGPLSDQLLARFAFRAGEMDGYFVNDAQPNGLGGNYFREVASRRLPYGSSLSGRATLIYEPSDTLRLSLKAAYTHMQDSGVAYDRVCGEGRTTPLPTLGVADPYSTCEADGRISTANIPVNRAQASRYMKDDGELYDDHKSQYVVFRADKDLGSMHVTSLTSYYGYQQLDANSFSGATLLINSGQDTKWKQFSQELRLLTDLDGPFNATLGGFYSWGKLNFNYVSSIFNDPEDPATGRFDTFWTRNGFTAESYSAFAEVNWSLSDQLELAGGARVSHDKRESFVDWTDYVHPNFISIFAPARIEDPYSNTNVSPQVTLTYEPTNDLMVYAAYKQGYKSGGFNTSLTVTQSIVASADPASFGRFEEEKARGGEIGFRSTLLDGAMHFNATAYNYDYLGLQVQVFNAITQAQTVQNVGKLTVRGIELEADYDMPGIDGLRLHGAFAYNDATLHDFVGACYTGQSVAAGCNLLPNGAGVFQGQDEEGMTPPKAPEFGAQFEASYRVPVSDALFAQVSGGIQYTSEYNYSDALRPDAVQPGYTRFDAAVRFGDVDGRWELALIGRNLGNELVITSANDMPRQGGGTGTTDPNAFSGDLNAIVERGREVHATLSFSF